MATFLLRSLPSRTLVPIRHNSVINFVPKLCQTGRTTSRTAWSDEVAVLRGHGVDRLDLRGPHRRRRRRWCSSKPRGN